MGTLGPGRAPVRSDVPEAWRCRVVPGPIVSALLRDWALEWQLPGGRRSGLGARLGTGLGSRALWAP